MSSRSQLVSSRPSVGRLGRFLTVFAYKPSQAVAGEATGAERANGRMAGWADRRIGGSADGHRQERPLVALICVQCIICQIAMIHCLQHERQHHRNRASGLQPFVA